MNISDWLYWVSVGAFLGVGFVWPDAWWFSLFAVVLVVAKLHTNTSIKQLALGIWVAWFIKYLLALLWFWSTYPIEWLPLQTGVWQIVLVGVYWVTAALWLSLGVGVLVYGWWFLRKYIPSVSASYSLWIIPVLWVWAEIFGSFLFSLFTLGDGGIVSAKFSFGYSGYLLAQHPVLLQIAHWGGVYVLSVVFVLLAVCLFTVWRLKHGRLGAGALLVCMILFQGYTFQIQSPTQNRYHIAVIDTVFSPQSLQPDGSNRDSILTEAVEAALAEKIDHILLPEDSRYFTAGNFFQSQVIQVAEDKFKNHSAMIIDSGQVWRGDASVLQATIYDSSSQSVSVIDKRYLVPQGEYTPWLYKSALHLFGQKQIVTYIEDSRGYQIGEQTSQSQLSTTTPGVLFCFESVDPNGVRVIKNEHPKTPFIAHVISHAWFHEPNQLWHQLDTMLQVQAVWNDVYIVSAGNKTTGAVYTPAGEIKRQAPVATGEGWQVRLVSVPQ